MAAIEKRYQVFVSSTYVDLIRARQQVMQALLELDCIPSGMELFPAADDDAWTLIKKVIDDCDYYMVIIAGRYGSEMGDTGKSYTQLEYEYAIKVGKPVVAFLHKEPGKLIADDVEPTELGRKKLDEFRKLAQQKLCKQWLTADELGSVVSRSIVQLMKAKPGIGWVRADAIPSQSATDELLRLRRQIDELREELAAATAVSNKPPEYLSQGEDQLVIDFSFRAYLPDGYTGTSFERNFTATWNEIFAEISPLLIDEASDARLTDALNSFLVRRELPTIAKAKEFEDFDDLRNVQISDTAFGTIKVQLLALGLIQKSERKKTRKVGDRQAYWTLTPSGEALMMSLRAIRREGVFT
jgi:hypothetical protein